MAGIYIHIPFCKQACHYCDFHFSTNLKNRDDMLAAILLEIQNRSEYIEGQIVESIYFGGGTPSLLPATQLAQVLEEIKTHFTLNDPEVTLEANPDDLDDRTLADFRKTGINRLSIGIQTFDDERLKFLNRTHSSKQATHAITQARSAGFENISADLIFAIPPQNDSTSRFERDLRQLIDQNPEHVSLYNLTIEPKTVFGNWQAKNKLAEVNEDSSAEQYELAVELLTTAGFEHYEVSNFARSNQYSRHNSSYWKSSLYLGAGPGAHSYSGQSRTINVSNNVAYIRAIENNQTPSTTEYLSETQTLNEYILTRIRTKWGLDIEHMKNSWGFDLMKNHEILISELVREKKATLIDGCFTLTSKGFSIADEVTLRLFGD